MRERTSRGRVGVVECSRGGGGEVGGGGVFLDDEL